MRISHLESVQNAFVHGCVSKVVVADDDVGAKINMKSSKRWAEASTVRSLKGLTRNLRSSALSKYSNQSRRRR